MTRRPHMLGNTPSNPARGLLYTKLAIARKELGLDDDSYRAVLVRVGGHYSAKDMSVGQIEAVLKEFVRLGWKPKLATGKRRTPDSAKAYVRKVYAVWNEMAPLLASGGTREALRAFVERQTGVSAPEFLDAEQAKQIIEGLKAWRARLLRGKS
ncbi:Mu-like prophage protein gp16 [Gluconacetobacter sacchari DSM 12717]|uniref:Regulatory protein GemA n=2 Tax=Gluconacetobacter sacchari TaxID=92759 RepID=A0A7W4NQK5_9PROT|nr:regulatory protein GemA [Gluconacetobacter sacchari]MBB2160108.1 regulatory protein GemA [Gluconacetobacter sacchari]GBQ19859.1 Mu-like prophage protein gp16 [Gluconacetobacter sacchari DSM 12717]